MSSDESLSNLLGELAALADAGAQASKAKFGGALGAWLRVARRGFPTDVKAAIAALDRAVSVFEGLPLAPEEQSLRDWVQRCHRKVAEWDAARRAPG